MPEALRAPSGITIWNAMREELVLNLYQLPFTTLPPTIFHVYLHPADYQRVEGIVPRLVAELRKALTEEVRKINAGRARTGGVLSRLIAQDEAPPIDVPASGWEVHVHPDHNDALKPGHLGIESMLPMPAPVEFGGPPTTRIVRSVVTETGRSSTTIEVGQAAPPVQAAAEPDTRERATLVYDDERGRHVFAMRKDVLSIGRGGSSVWVDVQVFGPSKVSREHLRIRHDGGGRFFIQDLSAWGTSVNGETIPPAVKGPDGITRGGTERIDLAGVLVMQFNSNRT
jgi:hypothetical protein